MIPSGNLQGRSGFCMEEGLYQSKTEAENPVKGLVMGA